MSEEIALITGASSGIGLHLAREFASHGHPVVLVAPVQSELDVIASELRDAHGVEAVPLAKDLENPSAPEEIAAELNRRGLNVGILVNNAGFGQLGPFKDAPLERDVAMIRVNIEAVIRLTKLFLPTLAQRRQGRILNVASIAGFEPGPNLAVYHATKAFVLSFSEALATELQDSGVTITTLCPGATDTDFFPKAGMLNTRAFQGMEPMPPQDVAKAGYEALIKGERLIVPGAANKALVFTRRLMPQAAQAKKNQQLYQNVPPTRRKRLRGDVEAKAEKEQETPLPPGITQPASRLGTLSGGRR